MGIWKDGAQATLMLTFDFDAESLWLSIDPENAKRPGILSIGTYGAKEGVPLILKLLAERDLRATFFIPGWVAEQHTDVCRQIRDGGHEIGHHGYLHESISAMEPAEEQAVLLRGLNALERQLGVRPRGYRSPSWETSPATVGFLADQGFTYASNFMDRLTPYQHERGGSPSGIVELPVHWMLDDAPFYMYDGTKYRCIYPPSHVLEIWQEEFRGIYELGGLCNIAMHPQFIGRPSRINMLRQFLDYVHQFPNLWRATGSEVAEFWLSRSEG